MHKAAAQRARRARRAHREAVYPSLRVFCTCTRTLQVVFSAHAEESRGAGRVGGLAAWPSHGGAAGMHRPKAGKRGGRPLTQLDGAVGEGGGAHVEGHLAHLRGQQDALSRAATINSEAALPPRHWKAQQRQRRRRRLKSPLTILPGLKGSASTQVHESWSARGMHGGRDQLGCVHSTLGCWFAPTGKHAGTWGLPMALRTLPPAPASSQAHRCRQSQRRWWRGSRQRCGRRRRQCTCRGRGGRDCRVRVTHGHASSTRRAPGTPCRLLPLAKHARGQPLQRAARTSTSPGRSGWRRCSWRAAGAPPWGEAGPHRSPPRPGSRWRGSSCRRGQRQGGLEGAAGAPQHRAQRRRRRQRRGRATGGSPGAAAWCAMQDPQGPQAPGQRPLR